MSKNNRTKTPSFIGRVRDRITSARDSGKRLWHYCSEGVWSDTRDLFVVKVVKTLNLSVKSFLDTGLQSQACAAMSLVRNLAKQFAPFGITVNNMSPGVIATPRNADALADPEYNAKVMQGIPVGFAGDDCDCDGAVLLLCSAEGRYITGIDLVVDGGMSL